MSERPELKVMYGLRGPYITSVSGVLTTAEADEIIRSCKAYEGLVEIKDATEALFNGFDDFLGTDAIGLPAENFYKAVENVRQALAGTEKKPEKIDNSS